MYNADSFHGPSIDRQEFFKKSTSTGISSIMISFAGRETCLPNHHFGPAIRAQYLLHFILKGKGRFSVNNKTYFLGENQAFLIQPNVAAYYAADSDDPWEYIWIGFDGADIQPILQNCGFLSKTPYISYPASDALIQNLSCIIEGMRDSSKNEYELLGSLFMVFGYLTRTQAEAISTSENSHLEKAVAFIKNNYYKSISVQTLSDYVGVDRTYLYRLFVRKFGISPKKYIFEHRFHVAIDLLANTDLTISAIALHCGYKDTSAFCSHFKKYTGFTPKQYRSIDGNTQFTWKAMEE